MAEVKVHVHVDAAELQADVDLLEKAIATSPRLLQRLEAMGDPESHVVVKKGPAVRTELANGLSYRLGWSAEMAALVAAVKAGAFDDE